MALKFLPSLTKTCREPFDNDADDNDVDDDAVDELRGDFKLPNLRIFNVLLLSLPFCVEVLLLSIGGIYFKPTIISPLYVVISSNGSL